MQYMISNSVMIGGIVMLVILITWRMLSRRRMLPCPAWLSWLVEMDNPLAPVTSAQCVIALLGPDRGAHIADIGCGPGRVTLPMASAVGPEGVVYALDIQAAMLEKIAAKAAAAELTNIRLLQGDARKRMLPQESLDGAVAVMSLGEIPDHPEVLQMIYSVLRPGGRFVVAESVFDPHYVSKSRLIADALAAGFAERHCVDNLFAYALVFERLRPADETARERSEVRELEGEPAFAPA
ncbi:MAG: methyltransferase domain-containing protein [Cephaloticoccus sp.]|nr:methyltransferase domain-containing protein [Cephaloticoccus sp.]